jgi:hypothetical protein
MFLTLVDRIKGESIIRQREIGLGYILGCERIIYSLKEGKKMGDELNCARDENLG